MFGRIRDDAFGLIRRERRRIGEQLAADVHCDAGAVSARRNIKNLLKSPDVSVIRGAKEQACGNGSFFKPFFLTIQFLFKSDGNGIGISLISLNGLFRAVWACIHIEAVSAKSGVRAISTKAISCLCFRLRILIAGLALAARRQCGRRDAQIPDIQKDVRRGHERID